MRCTGFAGFSLALLTAVSFAASGSSAFAQDAKPATEAAKRFIDRGSYIEDTETKLWWQKDGAASGKRNFADAAAYAKELKLGGIGGWRVPTSAELATIFPANEQPFINSGYNPNRCCEGPVEFRTYWTSERDGPPEKDSAYLYHWYAQGGRGNGYASKNFVYVRCVRDAGIARTDADDGPLDEAAVAKARTLIAELGHDDYQRRDEASVALAKLGRRVMPLLKETLAQTKDAEVRYRVQKLLADFGE